MTFNEGSQFDSSNVRKRSGRGAMIGGGGGIAVLLLGLLSTQLLGVDVTQFFGAGGGGQQQEENIACTGADANSNRDCRIEGAAVTLEQFWSEEAGKVGVREYRDPSVVIYSGQTGSGCGTASNAVGPFYCPNDEGIYMDTDFFDILVDRFGAQGGPLAEMYVVAHEWGHHIQHLAGGLTPDRQQDEGPAGGLVRLELQADCYAGAWMAGASRAKDEHGNQIMNEPTREEIEQTISAAQAIGDDAIMEQSGMEVQPEKFTHGTSKQRTTWLMRGFEGGVEQCDSFSVSGNQL